MKFFYRTLLKGLGAVVPVAVTAYVLVWLILTLENALGGLLKRVLPDDSWYVPGIGVLAGVGLVFLAGLLLEAWLLRRLWQRIEGLFDRVPLLRSVYSAIRDLTRFVANSSGAQRGKDVVMVSVGDPPVRLLGIVTRHSFRGAPEGMGGEDEVAVYLPMSYQMGGFTVFVSRDRIESVDLSVEDGLRYALTAAVGGNVQKDPDDRSPNEEAT